MLRLTSGFSRENALAIEYHTGPRSVLRNLDLRPGPAGFNCRADASARPEFSTYHCPHWIASLHHIFEHLVHDVLLENAQVPIAEEIFLERFQFQTSLAGHV